MFTGIYLIMYLKTYIFLCMIWIQQVWHKRTCIGYILGSLRNGGTVREGMARGRKSLAGSQRGLCLSQHRQGERNGPPP